MSDSKTGRERKDELVARANRLAEQATEITLKGYAAPLTIDLANLVRDMADMIANPPCCDGGPQWGHAWTCPLQHG